MKITPIFEMLAPCSGCLPNINLCSGHLCAGLIFLNRLQMPQRKGIHLGCCMCNVWSPAHTEQPGATSAGQGPWALVLRSPSEYRTSHILPCLFYRREGDILFSPLPRSCFYFLFPPSIVSELQYQQRMQFGGM